MSVGTDTREIHSRNPATHERLGAVRRSEAGEIAGVVAEAAAVQPLWAGLRLSDRALYLRRAAQAVIDEFDELGELLARESGRPRAEVAAFELLPAIDTLRWIAGSAAELLGTERIGVPRALHPMKRAAVTQEPAGIVAVITADSSPLAAPLGQIAGALVGGNGIVFKPSPRACLAGERLARLLGRAGLPEGLLRIVHGDKEVGRALARDSGVARVLFTGNARVGGEVARECAAGGRGAVLEVGGADSMLVLEDANVPRAVAGALWAMCAGAGQPHGAVKRIFVAHELHERFVYELVSAASRMQIGDPLSADTQLGPLATLPRRERLVRAIAEAVEQGAELRCGGVLQPGGLPGAFYSPAVLCRTTSEMRVRCERIPGPVVSVSAIASASAGIAMANSGAHGLGASVWTADRYRGQRIARELRAGSVWINDHLPSPGIGRAPWGGVAGGSVWRTQGAEGLRACVQPKLITWDPADGRSPWWHPYDDAVLRAARAIAMLGSVRDADRERALRHGTLAMLRVARRSLRGARRR
ncbi:MAG: aminobutyraldehyde dehydrogenase [Solirubrobacteraceae bacterium]